MAAGALCVVTDTIGMDELIEDGEHGFVVARSDLDAAVAVIDRVFSNPAVVPEITQAARKRVCERFDVEATIGDLLERWESLVHERRS